MTLVAKNVCYRVLQDISIAIGSGELLVISGPSGAGKTTLLRVIAGLEPLASGEILVAGKSITKLPPHRRQLAMLFQQHCLFPHLTVMQNLAFPLQRLGISRRERADKIDKMIAELQIGDLAVRYPHTLSGGERQRVALASVLLLEPHALLLDEPLVHLDIPNQYLLRRLLKRVQRTMAIPLLYVTHDQAEAMAMADRLGILMSGRLCQVAPPRQIYRNPATLEVAQFVGVPPINTIAGKIIDGCLVTAQLPPLPWPRPGCGEVIAALRPEHIYLRQSGIAMVIERLEYQGAEQIVYLRRQDLQLRCRISAAIDNLVPGKLIGVVLDLSAAVCFPVPASEYPSR